jgi:heat shock protein HtpX
VLHAFGGRPLNCVEAPGLYAILADISRRAGLAHTPELFLLPCEGMNAYALGDPEDACISVTRELLRRLSREEIAGILAHEVAHILHRDSGAMRWAFAIQREIADLVRRGIGDLMTRCQDFVRIGFQALLLAAAPVMAELLIAALSRVRELAADARAMDLIDHPKALVAALCKLEYFHTGLMPSHAHLGQNAHALHSHPGTWERISFLA